MLESSQDECRYGLFNFEYELPIDGSDETVHNEKLLLVLWRPDTAKLVNKLIYSSGVGALEERLSDIDTIIQVSVRHI